MTRRLGKLGPIAAVKEMRDRFMYITAEIRAVVQTICTADSVPGDYKSVAHSLQVLPAVIDWLQRSAYQPIADGLAPLASLHPAGAQWCHYRL